MKKVRLGRINLYVNQLGWGGIPIQRVNEQEAVSAIKAVIDMGVELLDTARGYTNSESRIGLALQTTDREVILSSKSQVRTDGIEDEVRISLREMKAKKIHLYHLHNISCPEDYEKVMGPGGAYEGLMRMRDEGGVIEEPGPALRFVLAQPDIVPIPGSETLEKARANWEIFTQDHSLTRRDRSYIEPLRRELDHQFCRRCDYCQPCPEKISIQHIMGLKYIVKRFGSSAEELDWFHSLIEKARHCTECGDCLKRCPYQLPIPEQIRKNLAWYDDLVKQG